ncbi:NnrU family protein [Novosphingobium lentum]|uniref:NnrU family protein n=1 Tax=Novosphingobium lentum TaxID=145287 RepID=UPI000A079593|nr:NnrU family protein [Novosphingobium lentum]
MTSLVTACLALLAGHFVLSHPLRKPLVKAVGPRAFLALYSLVAAATFAWMIMAFAHAPTEPALWDGTGDVPWLVSSLLTIVALALFLASLAGNPALPQANVAGLSTRKPSGVFRITRHPMMWGFALWAIAHMLVAPTPRTLVLAGTILILALVGAWLQDRKKVAMTGREWRTWMSRTRFAPGLSDWDALGWTWGLALIAWVLVTLVHVTTVGIPAGIWKWIDVASM